MRELPMQDTVVEIDRDEPFHDLEALAREVHKEYFHGETPIEVIWGKKITRRRRQSIRLGSYDYESRLIRIHPALDSPRVPAWFIQSIIFHEYLHHFLGPKHNRRFQRYERYFRYHRESKTWLKRFLPMLLGSRPLPMRDVHPRRAARSKAGPRQIALF